MNCTFCQHEITKTMTMYGTFPYCNECKVYFIINKNDIVRTTFVLENDIEVDISNFSMKIQIWNKEILLFQSDYVPNNISPQNIQEKVKTWLLYS